MPWANKKAWKNPHKGEYNRYLCQVTCLLWIFIFFYFFFGADMVKPMSNGGPPEISLSGTTSSAPWAGATVATVMPPLLHCPIATPGSPRGNNQCSTAESIQAAHAVAGIQTHHPLIRGNLCLRTATTSWATESLQPAYPCHDGDLNPQPSHQRE